GRRPRGWPEPATPVGELRSDPRGHPGGATDRRPPPASGARTSERCRPRGAPALVTRLSPRASPIATLSVFAYTSSDGRGARRAPTLGPLETGGRGAGAVRSPRDATR